MMKIFITDLQAYNNGNLVGSWYELPMTQNKLELAIQEVLERGKNDCLYKDNHEEVFITDYEADITINEHDDIFKLNELADILDGLSEHDLLKLNLLSYEGYSERDILTNGIDTYEAEIYDYSSDTSFTDVYELLAYEFVSEGLFGDVPKNFEHYIDYSAIGRDLSMEYVEFEHGIVGRVA